MSIEDLTEAFELLSDWDDRYSYISDLGEKLPPLPEADRVDANLVHGCMTRVWITGRPTDGEPFTMSYRADAEGPIIKGLVAVLLTLFADKTPAQVLGADADALIDGLGLEEHLSPNRHVGMYAMVDKIRAIARNA
jgi:cysteine desulfuration protein SufE